MGRQGCLLLYIAPCSTQFTVDFSFQIEADRITDSLLYAVDPEIIEVHSELSAETTRSQENLRQNLVKREG